MVSNFDFKEVNTKFIVSDRTYQREVDEARVCRMLANFKENLVNPPKLSFRDGKYFVFDGAHTVQLLKARNCGKDTTILCKVFHGLTQLDEAILFEQQNGIVGAVNISDKLRSMFNRGESGVVEMVRVAEHSGLIVDFKPGSSTNRIVAVGALYGIFKTCSRTEYANVLSIIKEAWGGKPESLRREILTGITIFCKAHEGKYSKPLLIAKLKSISPIEIIREGNLSKEGGSKKYARQIADVYNKRLSKNRLDS